MASSIVRGGTHTFANWTEQSGGRGPARFYITVISAATAVPFSYCEVGGVSNISHSFEISFSVTGRAVLQAEESDL